MGYALPPGTIVATQAWSMHRDSSVFPSPSTFLPDRWLQTCATDNTEQLAQMQQHYMPFGTCSRGCGGQNLAMMVLRITVAAVARNFDTVTPAIRVWKLEIVSYVAWFAVLDVHVLTVSGRSSFPQLWSASWISVPALSFRTWPAAIHKLFIASIF